MAVTLGTHALFDILRDFPYPSVFSGCDCGHDITWFSIRFIRMTTYDVLSTECCVPKLASTAFRNPHLMVVSASVFRCIGLEKETQ
jgi:hypothetical protein